MECDIKTKIINYKGKEKVIPIYNSNPLLCENFIIAKMRYCKFEKSKNSQFCIYHTEDDDKYIECPIDPSHKVLKTKLKKHRRICNKLEQQNKMKSNIWYSEGINVINDNKQIKEELNKLYELR